MIETYNGTVLHSIKIKPKDINKNNETFLLQTVYNRPKIFKAGKFKTGDYVRINKYKGIFRKGYEPNWSNEIF